MGREAWEKFKACLGRILPARATIYYEGIDLHHCLRKRSSHDMNIGDLFLGKPDKASMSLLANLSRSLLEAGCKQYPVVYRELGGVIGNNEPLVGYQYTLEKHDKELASVVIVRAIPGRMPAKVDLKKVMDSKKEVDSEEDDGVKDIDVVKDIGVEVGSQKTPPLTDDQKEHFYPLHPQLISRAVGLAGIEQLASRMLPDSEEHYSFSGTAANTMKNGKLTVVQGSSLKPLVEAKNAFYSSFSGLFAQPNVRDLLVTTFNQYLVEGKETEFNLDIKSSFAHLDLDAKNKISFNLYFVPHRVSS